MFLLHVIAIVFFHSYIIDSLLRADQGILQKGWHVEGIARLITCKNAYI